MPIKPLPPVEDLRNNFAYDCETGLIRRKKKKKQPVKNSQGYICFRFLGQYLAGHRIAWALHYGKLPPPEREIDHINGIRDDNRITNLRLVSMSDNMKNKTQYKNNRHGYPGILFDTSNRRIKQWRAQIQVDGKQMKLGSYMCKTAAIFARKRAELEHGFTELAGDRKWQLSTK